MKVTQSPRKSLVEANICDTGFIFLNESYFMRYLSGLYTRDHKPSFATKLQVFDARQLERCRPWIVDVSHSDVRDFGDCNDDSLHLESGTSSRVASFNVHSKEFKILDIRNGHILLTVNFG